MPNQTQTEIARLASEHAQERDAAILWLLEHKAQSHAPLVVELDYPDLPGCWLRPLREEWFAFPVLAGSR